MVGMVCICMVCVLYIPCIPYMPLYVWYGMYMFGMVWYAYVFAYLPRGKVVEAVYHHFLTDGAGENFGANTNQQNAEHLRGRWRAWPK